MTRINTNVESLIARRALNVNNAALNRSLERLSTGLRINSGRDDPAGLIASETLRSSMRAIATAVDNANRADTIVAVAEGGLQEISTLLLELENLIDQTANEAGLTSEEVAANQLQIDSILASINRLANSTAFGDNKLLNGNYDFTTSGVTTSDLSRIQINSAKIPAGAYRQVNVNVVSPSTFAQISAVGGSTIGGNQTLASAATMQIRGIYGSEILSFASGTSMQNIATAINASTQLTGVSATTSGTGGSPATLFLQSSTYGADAFVSVSIIQGTDAFNGVASNVTDNGTDGTITINGSSGVVSGRNVSVRSGSLSLDLTLSTALISSTNGTTNFDITGGGAVFSIAPEVGLTGQESIGISEVSTAKLGNADVGYLSSLGTGLTNSLSNKNFAAAQRIVRGAIDQVASMRGRLGGFQKDTLATTVNSLSVALENVTAAESAIRDADFAVETSNLTRAQILVNSSTAVLQIANALPQNALALLG
jgi:flagellin